MTRQQKNPRGVMGALNYGKPDPSRRKRAKAYTLF
jgi:hypothetical protein